MMERVDKSPESTKTIEKVELFTEYDLRNIQKTASNKHVLNTNLLHRHDHLGGHSSKVRIGDSFFYQEVFLKEIPG